MLHLWLLRSYKKNSQWSVPCMFYFLTGKEQQENCHTGQGGQHQEEAISGVPTQHRQAAQAGNLC